MNLSPFFLKLLQIGLKVSCFAATSKILLPPTLLLFVFAYANASCTEYAQSNETSLIEHSEQEDRSGRNASQRCGQFVSKFAAKSVARSVSSQNLRLGVIAPSALVVLTSDQLERFSFALVEASNQAGAPTATGTLTQISEYPLQYQYSPEPSDRLRGVQLNGKIYEFILQDIQGDFSGGTLYFFQQDHRLIFQAIEVGSSNILIEDSQVNGLRTIRVRGSGLFDGKLLTADVTGQGEQISLVTYRTKLSGQITGQGLSINVSEVSDSAQADMGYGFATKIQELYSRRINTSWTVGGVKFALRNGSILGKFRSGVPVEYASRWFARGTLLVNGKKTGGLDITLRNRRIVIALKAGRASAVMQSWNAP